MSKELAAALKATIELLTYAGESHWASRLRRDLVAIEKCDARGLGDFLEAYGGAGSFNELYLSRVNGHNVSERELPVINAQLDELRTRMFDLASALRAGQP